MPSLARRVTTGFALVLPVALAPATTALAAPTPPVPASATSTASPTDRPAASAGKATRRTPMRWRQYVAQKPAWSAKTCTADVTATRKLFRKNRPTVECARILAPLDYRDLSKGSMTIQITRVARTKPTGNAPAARALFLNPGGPGGPAGAMTLQLAGTKPALRSTHALVGVDPRGTGGSTPLPCTVYVDPVPDLRVTTSAVRTKVQAAYRNFAQKCVAAHRTVMPYITTENTVHDQDLARAVMGYRQADWYGVSGGSWMGAYFARLHPRTVGRVVVDANTNFSTDWRTSFHDLPKGFQRRYDQQFLPWAARHNREYGLGTTTRAVRANIAAVRAAAGKGRIANLTPSVLDLLTFQSLYRDAALPSLASSLGRTAKLLRTKKGTVTYPVPSAGGKDDSSPTPTTGAKAATPKLPTSPFVTVRTAILCNDGPFTRTPASFEKELRSLGKAYPLVGYEYGMILGPCAYWKVPTSAKVQIAGQPMPQMLMLQNQLDPATPIEGARKAHAAVRNTRMVTVLGAGEHGAFMSSTANACVDRITLTYLQKGTFPATDLTCTGNPLPGDKKVYRYTSG